MLLTMTPREFKQARLKLGLDRGQMGYMLGYTGAHCNDSVFKMEKGTKPIHPNVVRLMRAYLAGYRPPDWGENGYEDAPAALDDSAFADPAEVDT